MSKILTASQATLLFSMMGVELPFRAERPISHGIDLGDGTYHTVSGKWLQLCHKAWVDSLHPILRNNGLPVWVEERFDCENHCMGFLDFCSQQWAVMEIKAGVPHHGTAVFKFNFQSDDVYHKGPHARIAYIDHSGFLNVFEPALNIFTTISPKAWKSVWHISAY